MKDNSIFNSKQATPSQYENVKMDISKEGSTYLIANLTNLYTQPEIAVLREYTANALDSHVKAGNIANPILVDIIYDNTDEPSNRYRHYKSYTLTVEDFGTGMSKDDIVNIYSQYGASTKRDTNTQVGAFGLGAKSGLAIANQFFLRTRKNGIELDCVIRKDDDGVGIIEFVEEKTTTEPDGVKISIHVDKSNTNLLDTAQKFFATWKQGSVLLNGEEPYMLDNDPNFIKVQISDNEILGWIETYPSKPGYYYLHGNCGYVSLGGITYQIAYAEREVFRKTIPNFDKIFGASYINALIGSIDLTPPREGIRFSSKTIKTLQNSFENFIEFGKEAIQDYINHLPRNKAILFYNTNRALINSFWGELPSNVLDNTANWNGESFHTGIILPTHNDDIFYEMVYPKSAGLRKTPLETEISALDILSRDSNIADTQSHFFKMNLTQENLNETWFTRNIRDYAKHVLNGSANICVIATNDTQNSDVWLNALAPTLDSETMIAGAKAFRASKTKTVRPKNEVSYYVYQRSTTVGISVEKTSALTGKKMLYVEKKQALFPDRLWQDLRARQGKYTSFNSTSFPEFFALFNNVFKQYEGVVFLDGKSANPLVKLHPQIDSFSEVLENMFSNMNNIEQTYAGIYVNLVERSPWTLENLKSNCKKIVEQKISEHIIDHNFRNLVNFFGNINQIDNATFFLIAANKVRNYTDTTKDMFNILEVAPLLASNVSNAEHFVTYLNAIKFESATTDYEIKTQPYRYYQ